MSFINQIKKRTQQSAGTNSGRSFRFHYFRHRGNRQLLTFSLLTLPVIAVLQIPSWQERQFFGLSAQTFAYLCLAITLTGLVWSGIWLKTRRVSIERNGLTLSLPLIKLDLPWRTIRDFEAIRFDYLYPTETLSPRQLQKIGQRTNHSGVLIHVTKSQWGLKRWLIPWPIMGSDPNKIFLPVDQWSDFSQKLPNIMSGQQKKKRSVTKNLKALEQTDKKDGDILAISAGNREFGHLVRQLEETYSLTVSKDSIDAVRQFRANTPQLVIIDSHLPDQLSPLKLYNSLKQYDPRNSVSFIIASRQKLDSAVELDLFEAGIKELLNIKQNPQVAVRRIEFWLNWQEQSRNMAKRNQELYGQNLHQKSELARHGELRHFLPKDVAEEVIAGKFLKKAAQLRKQTITVLFADIVGFTPLSAQLEVDMLAELLNDYLQRMTQVVVNHGGIVDKFIGDEVMALFGAPDEEPETVQVQNAFTAALSMIEVVKAMDMVWQSRLPAELNIRVGINTGVCTAGLFGSESLRSYTVIGSPVNLAARLTSAAPPGGIATCANSLKWVQMRTKYSPLGDIPLKGISKPVGVFQVEEMIEPDFTKSLE